MSMNFRFGLLLLLFSQPTLPLKPVSLGSASSPLQKKHSVCVIGGGGVVGAYVFGYLQRCSSLPLTGISSVNGSPRCVCRTPKGSAELNSCLSRAFKLAVATEDKIRLVDGWEGEGLKKVLNSDYVVMGTRYDLRKLRIWNTNDYEIFLGAGNTEDDDGSSSPLKFTKDEGKAFNFDLFQKTLESVNKGAHMVVLKTHEGNDEKYLEALRGRKFSFIRASGDLIDFPNFTFESGLLGKINVKEVDSSAPPSPKSSFDIYKSDLAAVAVKVILHKDPTSSRVLDVVGGEFCGEPDEMTVRRGSSSSWLLNEDKLVV